ncbi:MAG: BrnA antitoxin family protein [Magnetococcales bacterium]|nr:BrnA antitoxin family protein [Magnetococcales bacterium]
MNSYKPGTIIPTLEEDAVITAAALSDPDATPCTDAEWEAVKPTLKRGRPLAAVAKERITIRLSPEVVQTFRASGKGWQTRVDTALKDWLKTHSPA